MVQLKASIQTRAANHFRIQLNRLHFHSPMVHLLLVSICHPFSSRQVNLLKKELVFYPHLSRVFFGLRQTS